MLDGYGGAINDVHPTATVLVHREQLFCIRYTQPATKSERRSAASWIKRARKLISGHVSGG